MTSSPARSRASFATLLALGLIAGVALWGASRDITSEDAIATHTDMPRYLMNGVFLRDFAASG
jgi:hypothetical protein